MDGISLENVELVLRNGTTEEWNLANPILALGEIGVDTIAKNFKIGDGATPWKELSFVTYTVGEIDKKFENLGKGLEDINNALSDILG